MRWTPGGSDPDVIDARGGGGGSGFGGGTGVRVGGGLGLVATIIVIALQVLGGGGGSGAAYPVDGFNDGVTPGGGAARGIPAAQDPDKGLKDFSSYVFTRVQRTWEDAFRQQGRPYQHAKLLLFSQGVDTGCGPASSATGPFYCPADQRVYIDLSFLRAMGRDLGASGDFAQAYVIAHEMGHHVQRQLGTSEQVSRLEREKPDDANALSVRLELQADCYAGVWAHTVYAAGDLEAGDVDEALGAAASVGDDRLQRRAGGGVHPESFTHGTSEQRARWFRAGQERGEPGACDTFAAQDL